MLDLFAETTRRDPYPLYERLRVAAPVIHEPRTGIWLLLDYEGCKRALHDHEAFGSTVAAPESAPGRWLIFADPPRHAVLRALVTRAFTSRAVAGLEPRVQTIVRSLLSAVLERGEMDLVSELAVPLPLMVISELLGVPPEDWRRFRAWSDVIADLANTLQGGDAAARAGAAFVAVHLEMQRYLAPHLAASRTDGRDDLLSRLVHAEVDGARLTDDELLAFFELLLLAGHETTTNLIDNAVLSLAEHPKQLARLRARPELLPLAIEEVLRFRSPVQAVFRVTRQAVSLHGESIPAGALVLAMLGSANRDPAQFPDAEELDVGRTPNAHVAFGHGIHFCVGAPLARLEARVALGEILSAFRTFDLASDAPWTPRPAFHVHGPSRLDIRFEPARETQRR